jgi:hypothetical protein
MKISRCCLVSSAVAVLLAALAMWQFYAHIDQGITLAYSEGMSDERGQVIEQLRALALGELRGKSRDDIVRLIEGQGRAWFAKDGDRHIIAEPLVFEFDGQGLAAIYSMFEELDK